MSIKPDFGDCKTIEQVVFQAIGYGSVCWENPGGAGVFNSQEAEKCGKAAVARIEEIYSNEQ